MQGTVRASLQKEGCSACPGPCPAPPLEESNTVTWSSKVLEQTRGTRQPSDCTSASLTGCSLNSCLCNSFQLFVDVGLYIDLLSSVKNQFYMILLFSEVFFISAELLILTKKKEHLGFSFVVLIRKTVSRFPLLVQPAVLMNNKSIMAISLQTLYTQVLLL